MAFRKTISQAELGQNLTAEERANGPVYNASQGGWVQPDDRPTAGGPNGTDGRLKPAGE